VVGLVGPNGAGKTTLLGIDAALCGQTGTFRARMLLIDPHFPAQPTALSPTDAMRKQ
jgi:ABC-type multidrug transport system ATPase subunit